MPECRSSPLQSGVKTSVCEAGAAVINNDHDARKVCLRENESGCCHAASPRRKVPRSPPPRATDLKPRELTSFFECLGENHLEWRLHVSTIPPSGKIVKKSLRLKQITRTQSVPHFSPSFPRRPLSSSSFALQLWSPGSWCYPHYYRFTALKSSIFQSSAVRMPTVTFFSWATFCSSTTITVPSVALLASNVTAATGTTTASFLEFADTVT